jgi:hypothetical protein
MKCESMYSALFKTLNSRSYLIVLYVFVNVRLKLHHMNLLNEIQETTLMMNLYQQVSTLLVLLSDILFQFKVLF